MKSVLREYGQKSLDLVTLPLRIDYFLFYAIFQMVDKKLEIKWNKHVRNRFLKRFLFLMLACFYFLTWMKRHVFILVTLCLLEITNWCSITVWISCWLTRWLLDLRGSRLVFVSCRRVSSSKARKQNVNELNSNRAAAAAEGRLWKRPHTSPRRSR